MAKKKSAKKASAKKPAAKPPSPKKPATKPMPQTKKKAPAKKAKPAKPAHPDVLLMAARQGNVQQVAQLLAEGVEPDLCYPLTTPNSSEIGAFRSMFTEFQESVWGERNDHYCWTALHIAARYGHVEVVRQLIEAGADVNASSKYDETPLHRALFEYIKEYKQEPVSIETREAIVKLLIDAGANVNVVDRKDMTPLSKAIYVKDGARLVEMIVQAGADVNAHGALHSAVWVNNPEILWAMLASGRADLKRRKKKQTVLEYAKSLKRTRMVQLLEHAEKR